MINLIVSKNLARNLHLQKDEKKASYDFAHVLLAQDGVIGTFGLSTSLTMLIRQGQPIAAMVTTINGCSVMQRDPMCCGGGGGVLKYVWEFFFSPGGKCNSS